MRTSTRSDKRLFQKFVTDTSVLPKLDVHRHRRTEHAGGIEPSTPVPRHRRIT